MSGIGSDYTLMGHSLVPQITSSFPVLRWAPWLQIRQRHVRGDFLKGSFSVVLYQENKVNDSCK